MPLLNTPKPLTSKKPFCPPDGPITGLVARMGTSKSGLPKTLTVETVGGTFEVKLEKSQRAPLAAEISTGTPVRVWVRNEGRSLRADYVAPLEARPNLEVPIRCSTATREACIWVCTSKSCCRKGGAELLERVQEEACKVDGARLRVRECGCLGTCKKGPSLKVRGEKKIHQVAPGGVPALIARVVRQN